MTEIQNPKQKKQSHMPRKRLRYALCRFGICILEFVILYTKLQGRAGNPDLGSPRRWLYEPEAQRTRFSNVK